MAAAAGVAAVQTLALQGLQGPWAATAVAAAGWQFVRDHACAYGMQASPQGLDVTQGTWLYTVVVPDWLVMAVDG